MKKLVAALLASTCMTAIAFAQEVPFAFRGVVSDAVTTSNDVPEINGPPCSINAGAYTLSNPFVKNFGGLDYFMASSCVHKPIVAPYSQQHVERISIWLYKTSTGSLVANNYLIDCTMKTTQRAYTGSGQSAAEIVSTTVPVTGTIVSFANVQPITTVARELCASFGALQ